MSTYKEITITPFELLNNKIIYKRIILNKTEQVLFHGQIVDINDNPIEGAIILVTTIDVHCKTPSYLETLYAVTNDDGEYALTLAILPDIDYQLNVFAPMIKSASKYCNNYLDKK